MLIKSKNTFKKTTFPIIAFSVFLLFFILLTDSVNVHAEGNSYTLPYNVVNYQNNNSACMAYLNDIFNAISSDVPSFNLNDCLLVPYRVRSNVIYIYCLSDPYIDQDYSSVSSIWQSTVVVKGSTNSCIVSLGLAGDGSLNSCAVSSTGMQTATLFGQNDIEDYYSSSYTYQINYPFFANSYIYDIADNLVIDVNFEWTPDEATFQEFQEGLGITSTIANGIDDSLSDLQNQKGFFDNLIFNLKNMFNSLNGWINNAFSNLSSNFKNFFGPFLSNIQNFISQIKGSVEDFRDHFSHFFEIINSIYNMSLENGEFSLAKLISVLLVPSQEDLTDVFSGTPLYTLYKGIITAVSNFYSTITGVLNSNYVYVFSLPTFTFGGKTFTGLQFSFDWYIPYKSYGDAIISVFLIIAYIRFLMNFIPNFFYGSGFIDHDVNTIHGRTDSL